MTTAAKSLVLVMMLAASSYGLTIPTKEVKVYDNGLVGYIPRRREIQKSAFNQGHNIQRRSHGSVSTLELDSKGSSDESVAKDKSVEADDMVASESRFGFGGGSYESKFHSFLPYPPPHRGPYPGAYPPPFGQQHRQFPGRGWGNHLEQAPCHGRGCHHGFGQGRDGDFEQGRGPQHGFDHDHGYHHGFGNGHDHRHEYGHGYQHGHGHGYGYGHGHGHGHGYGHGHGNDRNDHYKGDGCDYDENNSDSAEALHSSTTESVFTSVPNTQRTTTTIRVPTTPGSTPEPIYDIDVRLGSK